MQSLSSGMCAGKAYIVAPLITARRLAEHNLAQNPNRTLLLVIDPARNAINFSIKHVIVCKYVVEWCDASALSCEDWHKTAGTSTG